MSTAPQPSGGAGAAGGALKTAGRSGRSTELPEHLKAYKGVWVFIEHDRGQVHSGQLGADGPGAHPRRQARRARVSGVLMGGPADEHG